MSFDFSTISNKWWDPDGPMRPLHDLTPTRGTFTLKNTNIQPKTALDFGCGAGILTEWLTEQSIKCIGVDKEQALIDSAIRHAKLSNLTIDYFCTSNLKKFQKVDLITCMEVLEHCNNYKEIVIMLSEKLNNNGTLAISTINNTWAAFCNVILGAEYLLNILPKGTHKKSDFIKPSSIIRIAQMHGLQLKKAAGIEYLAYSRKGIITENLEKNYILIFTKI